MRLSARLAQALASQDPDGAALWVENRPITWGEFRRGIADRRRVWEYTTPPGATLRLRVANTPESIMELLAALLSERVPILHNAHHPVPDKDEALPVRTSETLLFLHSSGTTGREKLAHRKRGCRWFLKPPVSSSDRVM